MHLDAIDRKILALVQEDASLSMAALAERVGLSATPCWRRLQKLEEAGIIRRKVALLDADKLGLGLTVFVSVRTNQHNADWLDRFTADVVAMPEVLELTRLTGAHDYLLKVVVRDMTAFDHFYKRLIAIADLSDVTSAFAMERIKHTTALPVAGGSADGSAP